MFLLSVHLLNARDMLEDNPATLFRTEIYFALKASFMLNSLSKTFTGKSQEAPQLAVGRNGKRGFGGDSPHYGFFLGISPGHIAQTSSRNKIKSFRFEALELTPGRFTRGPNDPVERKCHR